jgi:4'-phosphopantetheinyl transferase
MESSWPISLEVTEIEPEDAHVWAVSLDAQVSTGELLNQLSPEDRKRAGQFRREAARRRFVVARAALRSILGRYLTAEPGEVALAQRASGKPYLVEFDAPAPLRFNVAHSHELALVAVTRDSEVGVDIERLREVNHWPEILNRYFHDSEAQAIARRPAAEQPAAFMRCWTAKEAVLKAIGTGLSDALQLFAVPVREHKGKWLQLPARFSVPPEKLWLRSLPPIENYVAAIAIVGDQKRLHCFTWAAHP